MNNLERFVQDDGRTMRNRLGIRRDPEAFEYALAIHSGERISELRETPSLVPDTFDRHHIKALHRHIFQDIFEWAGHTRDEIVRIEGEQIGPVKTMAKSGGAQFDDAKDLVKGFAVLEMLLDVERAKNMSSKDFATHAARVFIHLNWMHPFREGNGRVQREFINRYATCAGHRLDFSVVTQERMYDASARSTRDTDLSMTPLFQEISDPECTSRMRPAYDGFNRNPGFQGLYFAHTRPGQAVEGALVGRASNGFALQRKDASIFVGDLRDLPNGASVGQNLRIIPK